MTTTLSDRRDAPAPVVPRATAERLVVAALRLIRRPLNPTGSAASFEGWLGCSDGVSAVADRLAVGGCWVDDQWVEFESVAVPGLSGDGAGMRRSVALASGGSISLAVDADLSEMSSTDRRLVLDLLGRIAVYAASHLKG